MTPVPGGWEIKGVLSRDGPERFVSLRFGLPVNVEGWRFWQDIVRTQTMMPSSSHDNLGWPDPMPFTAISSERGALAFAVRMDEQWFRRVTYDGDTGLFAITLDYALVDGQEFYETQAPVRFYLLAPPGEWGLRSVIDAYFALFPEWREDQSMKPGGWMAWGDLLRGDMSDPAWQQAARGHSQQTLLAQT